MVRKEMFQMIYITGDCHREYRRFNTQNFPEQKGMTKEDCLWGFWRSMEF